MNYSRLLPFLALLIVYLIGAFGIDIMDIDAAQYASIGREMAENNQFLDVQFRGQDYYLDKPPLLFWVSALMFKLLGPTNMAYRLVPILSTLLGMYAVERFTRLYYSTQTAYIAALVLGSCQAFFLMNHDVRCDTLLTNCVMVAIWQLAAYLKNPKQIGAWRYFVGAFVFVGLGMLAKGPISVIVVGAAFFFDLLLKRQWRSLFHPRWIVGVLIVLLVLIPYCIGLYQQYGSHGLYFFFWEQSFGRITGENEWKNDAGLFFQAQNFLWSFLPWVLVFVAGLVWVVKDCWTKNFRLQPHQEAISLFGFLLPFAALSTAQYQLPHYTFVVFPLAAVLTARYLSFLIDNAPSVSFQWTRIALIFTSVVMLTVVLILLTWAFPLRNVLLWGILILMTLLIWRLYGRQRPAFSQLVFAPFLTALVANLALNAHFYPTLLTYQTGSVVGQFMQKQPREALERFYVYDIAPVEEYNIFHSALDFYSRRTTPVLRKTDDVKNLLHSEKPLWLYTDQQGLDSLRASGMKTEEVQRYQKFHVTGLTLPFLNPATRHTETKTAYLLKVR
ncbi:MAG: ArnT family glycosyltransferase [Runella sp.]